MAILEYERESYQKYLSKITHKGTYKEYEDALFEMSNLKNLLMLHGYDTNVAVDQVDNTYYCDILFHAPKGASESELYSMAGKIIGELINLNIIEPKCNDSCIYYNEPMNGFMFTAVAIEAEDGPALYKDGRKFTVR